MINTKQKWITIGIVFTVLLLSATLGLHGPKQQEGGKTIRSVQELNQKSIGGVKAKMPDASAKIFFESQFGIKLSSYQSFESIENTVNALKAGKISALWASDITAEWLVRNDAALKILNKEEGSQDVSLSPDLDQTDYSSIVEGYDSHEKRLEFAFGFRKEDEALRDEVNLCLSALKEDGRLHGIVDCYVNRIDAEPIYEEQMTVNQKEYRSLFDGKPLYVGITGAVPPLECIDELGKPYGFCVALADEVGQVLKRPIKFSVVDNETVFTELLSGRIDMVFCYGTSENHSTEFPPYLMSEGYYPMYEYQLVVLNN